jgi:indolepyruvate ferredoxin oxidoreductase
LAEHDVKVGYKLMAYKDEYEVARLLTDPLAEAAVRAVEIARLPDLVRGYESIKLANVALYRARVKELRSASESLAPADR